MSQNNVIDDSPARQAAQIARARKALLALAAGAHHEKTVNPKWVVATALQGLGWARRERERKLP